jgi:hypothetical protein
MSLKKTLQKQNYDLIDGPIRNHELLQIWTKRKTDRSTLYSRSLGHLFELPFEPPVLENESLSINSEEKEEFDFSAGIGFVENALLQFQIPDARLDQHIKGGKFLTVSYNQAVTREIEMHLIEKFLAKIDGTSLIHSLAKELELDNLIVITGLVLARELKVAIESDRLIDSGLEASLNQLAEGKVKFTRTSDKKMILTADTGSAYPIAVKAFRIRFKKNKFQKLVLATDNRDFF